MSAAGLKIRDAYGNLIDWDMPDHIPHITPIAGLAAYCSCGWRPTPRGPILAVHLQSEREGAWRPSGDVQPGGDVGGDHQVSDAYSVRFIRPDLPGSLITDYWYVERDERDGSYDVRCQIEFLLCRDPADPGSTELWAAVAYDEDSDPRDYAELHTAIGSAQQLAAVDVVGGAGRIRWNGRSRDIDGDPPEPLAA